MDQEKGHYVVIPAIGGKLWRMHMVEKIYLTKIKSET
jgi:hypothetical protein